MHFFSAFRLRRLGFLVGFGGNQDQEREREYKKKMM